MTLKKYCILCEEWGDEPWIDAWLLLDDELWKFSCGHVSTIEGQKIVDRNFGRLYDMEAE